MSAAYGVGWMPGDRPWTVTTPAGHLLTRDGGGFVQFATQPECEAFAERLTAGELRVNDEGRLPLHAQQDPPEVVGRRMLEAARAQRRAVVRRWCSRRMLEACG